MNEIVIENLTGNTALNFPETLYKRRKYGLFGDNKWIMWLLSRMYINLTKKTL